MLIPLYDIHHSITQTIGGKKMGRCRARFCKQTGMAERGKEVKSIRFLDLTFLSICEGSDIVFLTGNQTYQDGRFSVQISLLFLLLYFCTLFISCYSVRIITLPSTYSATHAVFFHTTYTFILLEHVIYSIL